ncbi:MAG: hypothetical protein RL094_446 [Candidatus Parcubacteria bacterium]|jgi:hypothetical protein
MKTRYTYGLLFLVIHSILSLGAILFVYDANIPNSDLGLIMFPNIFIPLLLTDQLPRIFGYWSNLYWSGIFWFIIGYLIGLIVEKRRLRKSNEHLQ